MERRIEKDGFRVYRTLSEPAETSTRQQTGREKSVVWNAALERDRKNEEHVRKEEEEKEEGEAWSKENITLEKDKLHRVSNEAFSNRLFAKGLFLGTPGQESFIRLFDLNSPILL